MLEGVNLSDDSPTVFISVDWNFDQGEFAGANCYASTADASRAVGWGCDVYAGYFRSFKQNNAVAVQLTRHVYSRAFNRSWDFTELSTSWHVSKKSSFTASYSANWLGLPYDAYSLRADTQIPVSESLALNLSANVHALESGAPVDELLSAKISFTYLYERWTTELGLVVSDNDQARVLALDIDEPEALLSVSYRLF